LDGGESDVYGLPQMRRIFPVRHPALNGTVRMADTRGVTLPSRISKTAVDQSARISLAALRPDIKAPCVVPE
jgi:hypothetical protein